MPDVQFIEMWTEGHWRFVKELVGGTHYEAEYEAREQSLGGYVSRIRQFTRYGEVTDGGIIYFNDARYRVDD